MNRTARAVTIVAAALLLISLVPAGGLIAQQPPPPSAAYVWRTDAAAADGYKSLIEGAGYTVTLLKPEELATADLSAFALFVVGSDTGYAYDWGSADAVRALERARRPILGLGYGGACLFEQLGLSINWGNGWVGPERRMVIAQSDHPVFTTPNEIDPPADGVLTLYGESDHIGEYAPALGSDVELIGREPSSTDHWTLVREDQAVLWGFTGSPYSLTSVGEQVFVNAVEYVGGLGAPGELLPDLVVTDAWLEGGDVFYQLANLGEATAPAGHATSLSRDGEVLCDDEVDVTLSPNERVTRRFSCEWEPSSDPLAVRVRADVGDVVEESDESNDLEETWGPDARPPRVDAGPTVSALTPTSATVRVLFDEPCEARLRYGTSAGVYEATILSEEYTTEHLFTLSGLSGATTYHLTVTAMDASGNRTASESVQFETPPETDNAKPTISVITTPIAEWTSKLVVDAEDDNGVSYVRFAIDGVEAAVDYAAPFEYEWDPTRLGDEPRTIDITAVDVAGNEAQETASVTRLSPKDSTRPVTTISTPLDDETVSGTIPIRAEITDDTGVESVTLMVDGYMRDLIEYTKPDVDCVINPEFTYDTSKLDEGSHRIAVLASDGVWRPSYGSELDTVDVWVEKPPTLGPPKLTVYRRQVVQHGTSFQVVLTVKNVGEQEARNVKIIDPLTSFQPISGDQLSAVYTARRGAGASPTQFMEIEPKDPIPAGSTRTYSYRAVPFMVAASGVIPMIGNPETELRWEAAGQSGVFVGYDTEVAMTTTQGTAIYVAHADALEASKHLIVTSPDNLRVLYGAAGADTVLSTAANLALVRDAVLGYLDMPSRFFRELDEEDLVVGGDLLSRGGDEVLVYDDSAGGVFVGLINSAATPGTAPPQGAEDYIWRWEEWRIEELDGFLGPDEDLNGDEYTRDRLAIGAFGPSHQRRILWFRSYGDSRLLAFDGQLEAEAKEMSGTDTSVACGDLTGDGQDEIVTFETIANTVQVWTVSENAPTAPLRFDIAKSNSFVRSLDPDDLVAVGDVTGDQREEIVLGDVSADTVFVLSGTGTVLHSFPVSLYEGDRLALGRPIEGLPAGVTEKDFILVAKQVTGNVVAYYADSPGNMVVWGTDFKAGDHLAAGQFTPLALRDSVLVGSVDDNGIELHAKGETSPQGLRALIASTQDVMNPDLVPTGEWSKRLDPSWVADGLLTIVGEDEIVPSWGGRDFGAQELSSGKSFDLYCDMTDLPYANTCGKERIPELTVGRIIGNSVEQLCEPMLTSIRVALGQNGYSFDRSKALLMSGFPAALSGNAASIDFALECRLVKSKLLEQGITNQVRLHSPDYLITNPDGSVDDTSTADNVLQQFFGNTPNSDILYLAGHGQPESFDVVYGWHVDAEVDPFGGANPVVYGSSCSTGNYTNKHSFATAMLGKGAGVYIGATRPALSRADYTGARIFFTSWKPGVSAPQALRETKRVLGSGGSKAWRYWETIFNAYGDAAYGAEGLPSSGDAIPPSLAASPEGEGETLTAPGTETLEVTLPDFDVASAGRYDEVRIPGGLTTDVTGRPEVPTYVVTREIPHGLSVTDVRAVAHSAPVISSGLDLPPLYEEEVQTGSDVLPVFEPLPVEADPSARDWWPETAMTWEILEGAESDTLAITLYPFDYSAATADARFTKEWTLAVELNDPPVRITGGRTATNTYAVGAQVELELALEADPGAPDVILEATVLDSEGEFVGGFPLQTLEQPTQRTSSSLTWDSGSAAPGHYTAEVCVKDMEGRVLDTLATPFTLGSAQMRATSITADPPFFTPGGTVDISLEAVNEGDLPAGGTATISILDESNATIAELDHEYTDLAPGSSATFDFEWDTAGVEPGVYTARGRTRCAGSLSNDVTVRLPSATPHADAGPDQTAERDSIAGVHVTLDGSASFGPAGADLSYTWMWPGGSATGVSPTVVLPPGETDVTLTVSAEGQSDVDTMLVRTIDTSAPTLAITVPAPDEALQDGVNLEAEASDWSGVAAVEFSIRASSAPGAPIGFEHLAADRVSGTPEDGLWRYPLDSRELPDGYYLVRARAADAFGNDVWTQTVAISIRNWALAELLPESGRFNPGRTVPIKFTIRLLAVVDPLQAFVYNEQLEIRIYDADDMDRPIQVSTFGEDATDYRIDQTDEFYITNFKTARSPATYAVEVWRPSTAMIIGRFTFETSK